MTEPRYVVDLSELDRGDTPRVGGKNASLGEMIGRLGGAGIRVPEGFATTADAYWAHLDASGLRAPIGEQEIAQKLPMLCKMASWGDINSILSAATPGAAVEVTYRPPPEIPVKAGVVYFVVSTENNYWRNVVTDRQIAVYLPRPFDPQQTKVELLGIPRKG